MTWDRVLKILYVTAALALGATLAAEYPGYSVGPPPVSATARAPVFERPDLALARAVGLSDAGAPGDTLVVLGFRRVIPDAWGPVDSVVWVITSPRTEPRRRHQAAEAVIDSVLLIPDPRLADGDSLEIRSCWTAWRGRSTSPTACLSATFRRIIPAPPAPIPDSLRIRGLAIVPDSVQVGPLALIRFCVVFTMEDGRQGVASEQLAVCPPGDLSPAQRAVVDG